MQPFALRADNESQCAFEMTGARLDLRPGLIQPDDSDVIVFERVDRLGQIRLRDEHVLAGTG